MIHFLRLLIGIVVMTILGFSVFLLIKFPDIIYATVGFGLILMFAYVIGYKLIEGFKR